MEIAAAPAVIEVPQVLPSAPMNEEKPSLRQIFEAEESPLLRFAHGLTGRRETAEDLVQEAFLRLHAHWEEVAHPKAWLYRSVRLLLAELRDEDRTLLELKYHENLKYDQISQRTGLSVGNVGYKLHHLLKSLGENLRRMGIDRAE